MEGTQRRGRGGSTSRRITASFWWVIRTPFRKLNTKRRPRAFPTARYTRHWHACIVDTSRPSTRRARHKCLRACRSPVAHDTALSALTHLSAAAQPPRQRYLHAASDMRHGLWRSMRGSGARRRPDMRAVAPMPPAPLSLCLSLASPLANHTSCPRPLAVVLYQNVESLLRGGRPRPSTERAPRALLSALRPAYPGT